MNDKIPSAASQPKTYDQLLPMLSPAMRKMCLTHTKKTAPEKSDEWFSSLQYLQCAIDDLTIPNAFLNPGSEFGGMNDAAIVALE